MENKAVCFTGHREIPQGDIKSIENKLDLDTRMFRPAEQKDLIL